MGFIEILYLLLFFCIPLSIENFSLGYGVFLPGELIQLLIVATLLWQWRSVVPVVKSHVKHPLFICATAYITWSWIDCAFAANIKISAKYTLIETMHFLVFMVGIIYMLSKNKQFFFNLVAAYCISFIPLLIKGWVMAAQLGFVISFSLAALWPFYNDHTVYGACIAVLLPLWAYMQYAKALWRMRWPYIIIIILLAIGLFMSFSRAAWLSAIISVAFSTIFYRFKHHFKKALIATGLLAIGLLIAAAAVYSVTQNNNFVKNTTVGNQVLSAFNWSYDVANLERINKYKCALKMIAEKPITGFGNNGYKYNYTRYQQSSDMTRISLTDPYVTARKGTGGNAHNEYLETFVNLGLPGILLWMAIVFFSLFYCINYFFKSGNTLWLALFCALLTFYLHGFVNNFFHDDKIAALVWLCWAVIVSVSTDKYRTVPLSKPIEKQV